MSKREFLGDAASFGRFGNGSVVAAGGYVFAVANAMGGGAGRKADLSVADEIRLCIDELKGMLRLKGLDFDALSRCNVFLASADLREAFWPAFAAEFGPDRLPVHSIYVCDMPGGCRVQLDAVAVLRG